MTEAVGLPRGVRLVHDAVRGRSALLFPEGVLLLNETAAAVLRECDGRRDVDWLRVFDQARALGVLQLHLSGSEPLLRRDLPALLNHARQLGCTPI